MATKKQIIQRLRELGYRTNSKNVLISTFETKNYVTVIQNGSELYKVPRSALCLQEVIKCQDVEAQEREQGASAAEKKQGAQRLLFVAQKAKRKD